MRVQWMFRATELSTEKRLRGVLTIFAREELWTASFSSSAGELVLQQPKLVVLDEDRVVIDMPSPFDVLSTELGRVRYLSLASEVPATGEPLGGDSFLLQRRLPVSGTTIRTVIAQVPVNPRVRP